MYLSKLTLNARERAVRRDLADCQAMHRRVMSGFEQAEKITQGARQGLGVLYRIESDARTGNIVLLVQSKNPPVWSELPRNYLKESESVENPACKRIDEMYETISDKSLLRFRLRANPTRKIDTKSDKDGKKRNGRRVELRDDDERIGWLARKGDNHGFVLREVRVTTESRSNGNRRDPEQDKDSTSIHTKDEPHIPRIIFGSVLFEGELIVTDREKFRASIAEGIGTGKAYGFGLLSVAPVRD